MSICVPYHKFQSNRMCSLFNTYQLSRCTKGEKSIQIKYDEILFSFLLLPSMMWFTTEFCFSKIQDCEPAMRKFSAKNIYTKQNRTKVTSQRTRITHMHDNQNFIKKTHDENFKIFFLCEKQSLSTEFVSIPKYQISFFPLKVYIGMKSILFWRKLLKL